MEQIDDTWNTENCSFSTLGHISGNITSGYNWFKMLNKASNWISYSKILCKDSPFCTRKMVYLFYSHAYYLYLPSTYLLAIFVQ